jgi:hypothetical protein
MTKQIGFTTTFVVDRTPRVVFDAVRDPRRWWSAEIEGETTQVGDEFVFDVPGIHRTKQQLLEVIANRRVVWLVTEAEMTFIKQRDEWLDTRIIFDIAEEADGTRLTFTHEGLAPGIECYDACMPAWTEYVQHSLRQLITTGTGHPNLEGRTIGTPVSAAS